MSTLQFSALQALRKKIAPNKAKIELRWRCRNGKAPESYGALLHRGLITCRSIQDPTTWSSTFHRYSPAMKTVIFILKKAEARARKEAHGLDLGKIKRGKVLYWRKRK